jgi:hypothetical protein
MSLKRVTPGRLGQLPVCMRTPPKSGFELPPGLQLPSAPPTHRVKAVRPWNLVDMSVWEQGLLR